MDSQYCFVASCCFMYWYGNVIQSRKAEFDDMYCNVQEICVLTLYWQCSVMSCIASADGPGYITLFAKYFITSDLPGTQLTLQFGLYQL